MTDFTIHVGDVREQLAQIPDGSIQTCITSPPYWGLRDYGTASWDGGDADCDHIERMARNDPDRNTRNTDGRNPDTQRIDVGCTDGIRFRDKCGKCGAKRIDSQLGLEPTPEQYVENMVSVFREVRRTLRDDGTLWLNLGDSYAGSGMTGGTNSLEGADKRAGRMFAGRLNTAPGLKAKDLVGIPWRVAFALQADGWYLRSDIIWAKPNPMPESVRDRPTKSHEYIFLLSKSARYYFDQDAVRGKMAPESAARYGYAFGGAKSEQLLATGQQHTQPIGNRVVPHGRNIRDVWTITTKPFPGAHFAVFPPEIPDRCIRAGTSERGGCAKCGAPMVRETEREGGKSYAVGKSDTKRTAGLATAFSGYDDGSSGPTFRTVGWRPSCGCDSGTTACTVLDPFTGSGTTGIVASKLGRHFVGVELNPEYAEMARRRIMDAPMSLFSA